MAAEISFSRHDIAKRLEALKDSEGWTYRDLAECAGVSQSQVTHWLQAKQAPSAEALAALGTSGISIDWILLGVGSMYRGQQRSLPELRVDLGAMLRREALTALREFHPDVEETDIEVFLTPLLADLVDRVTADLRRNVESFKRDVTAVTALRELSDSLQELSTMAATSLEPDEQRSLARVVLALTRQADEGVRALLTHRQEGLAAVAPVVLFDRLQAGDRPETAERLELQRLEVMKALASDPLPFLQELVDLQEPERRPSRGSASG